MESRRCCIIALWPKPGDGDLEIVQTWDAGKFEEITLKHWMATVPTYLLSNNMAGVSAGTLDKLRAG